MNIDNKLTAKELALLEQMQRMGYSQGTITVTLTMLRQSRDAQDELLLYIYEHHPSEKKFTERLAEVCRRM